MPASARLLRASLRLIAYSYALSSRRVAPQQPRSRPSAASTVCVVYYALPAAGLQKAEANRINCNLNLKCYPTVFASLLYMIA